MLPTFTVMSFTRRVVLTEKNTVKPPVSYHPTCKDQVVAYRLCSLTRIELHVQGVSSEKRSRLIYFMEDNLLHAMSKLGYV